MSRCAHTISSRTLSSDRPPPSSSHRIENQEIDGITATHVVREVAHRLMTIEAMHASAELEIGRHRPASSGHPAQVQTLKRFRQAVQEIPLLSIRIGPFDPTWLDPAAGISQKTGLLHNVIRRPGAAE
jgi:hypothetical protein